VTILNVDTGATFTTRTMTDGVLYGAGIPVGSYTVSVEQAGFKKAVRAGVILEVDRRVRVDFRLEVGAVTESLEVKGEALLVDTAGATVAKWWRTGG